MWIDQTELGKSEKKMNTYSGSLEKTVLQHERGANKGSRNIAFLGTVRKLVQSLLSSVVCI